MKIHKGLDEVVKTARFEGLIDLVDHEGEIGFLVKEGDELTLNGVQEVCMLLYTPPDKKSLKFNFTLILSG